VCRIECTRNATNFRWCNVQLPFEMPPYLNIGLSFAGPINPDYVRSVQSGVSRRTGLCKLKPILICEHAPPYWLGSHYTILGWGTLCILDQTTVVVASAGRFARLRRARAIRTLTVPPNPMRDRSRSLRFPCSDALAGGARDVSGRTPLRLP
jgi:hypothetical protein